jgi:nucleotide-binding universal stress UspA family protein
MTGIIKHSGALIVVGVDGAEASLTATRWAVQQAPLYQARVLLVFVLDQYACASYSGSPEVPACVSGDADRSALLAAAELEAVRALTPDRVSSELIAGSPAKVLIDRSADAKLLVLGTAYPPGDSTAAAPPPMGSVARACVRGAACPVMIVPHQWSCMPARA